MKNVPFLLATALVLFVCACKKTSSPGPSIVGRWSLVNAAGTSGSISANGEKTIQTYSFYADTLRYVDSLFNSVSGASTQQLDSIPVAVSYEFWAFGADGTYTIEESYNQYGRFPNKYTPYIDTVYGVWDYLSNSNPNSEILFSGPQPMFVIQLINNNMLIVQKLTDDTLVLANVSSSVNVNSTINSGTSATNLAYTFVKM